jgi:hypothetical protein
MKTCNPHDLLQNENIFKNLIQMITKLDKVLNHILHMGSLFNFNSI